MKPSKLTKPAPRSTKAKPNPLKKAVKALRSNELEERIVEMAVSGELAKFGHEAIKSQLEAGIRVTYVKEGKIIRHHPDGRIEVVGQVKKSKPVVLPGIARIGFK